MARAPRSGCYLLHELRHGTDLGGCFRCACAPWRCRGERKLTVVCWLAGLLQRGPMVGDRHLCLHAVLAQLLVRVHDLAAGLCHEHLVLFPDLSSVQRCSGAQRIGVLSRVEVLAGLEVVVACFTMWSCHDDGRDFAHPQVQPCRRQELLGQLPGSTRGRGEPGGLCGSGDPRQEGGAGGCLPLGTTPGVPWRLPPRRRCGARFVQPHHVDPRFFCIVGILALCVDRGGEGVVRGIPRCICQLLHAHQLLAPHVQHLPCQRRVQPRDVRKCGKRSRGTRRRVGRGRRGVRRRRGR
mmetsp:Transcript_9602/g.25589  ORF Transcript_9602/g.25589 Transcript_9602/m.25589 type:complete len:295 (+) Transcript_9602:2434-3318(+)